MPAFPRAPEVFPPIVRATRAGGDLPMFAFCRRGSVVAWSQPDGFAARQEVRLVGFDWADGEHLSLDLRCVWEPNEAARRAKVEAAVQEQATLLRSAPGKMAWSNMPLQGKPAINRLLIGRSPRSVRRGSCERWMIASASVEPGSWRASGLPAAEFAACEGLTASQIYAWSRAAGAPEGHQAPAFTELRLREATSANHRGADGPGEPAAIEIVIGDVSVRVRAGADLELLAAVLGVVSRC